MTSHSDKEFKIVMLSVMKLYKCTLNTVSGPEFIFANEMLDLNGKLYYKARNMKPKHKAVIEK